MNDITSGEIESVDGGMSLFGTWLVAAGATGACMLGGGIEAAALAGPFAPAVIGGCAVIGVGTAVIAAFTS